MFIPKLQLIPESDGEYSLLVTTPVPAGFSAGRPKRRGGKDREKTPKGTQAWTAPLRQAPAGIKISTGCDVYHRIRNLKLTPGDAVTVYLTIGKSVVAEMAILLGSEAKSGLLETAVVGPTFRADVIAATDAVRRISLNECIECVVLATPKPANFAGPAQALRQLGVLDDAQTRLHQGNAATQVGLKGGSIDPNAIISGPAVTVSQSSMSILVNQRGS